MGYKHINHVLLRDRWRQNKVLITPIIMSMQQNMAFDETHLSNNDDSSCSTSPSCFSLMLSSIQFDQRKILEKKYNSVAEKNAQHFLFYERFIETSSFPLSFWKNAENLYNTTYHVFLEGAFPIYTWNHFCLSIYLFVSLNMFKLIQWCLFIKPCGQNQTFIYFIPISVTSNKAIHFTLDYRTLLSEILSTDMTFRSFLLIKVYHWSNQLWANPKNFIYIYIPSLYVRLIQSFIWDFRWTLLLPWTPQFKNVNHWLWH